MSLKLDYNVITSDYSCSSGDTTIIVDTTTAAIQVTLPLASTENGRIIIVKDSEGSASVNNITVESQGSETVEGATSLLIQSDYGSIILASSGSEGSYPGWAFVSTN
jgi:hypothetical protein